MLFILEQFITGSSLQMYETSGFKLLASPWPTTILILQVAVIVNSGFLNNTRQMSKAFKMLERHFSCKHFFHTDFFFLYFFFFFKFPESRNANQGWKGFQLGN